MLCQHFLKGQCRFGANCKNIHPGVNGPVQPGGPGFQAPNQGFNQAPPQPFGFPAGNGFSGGAQAPRGAPRGAPTSTKVCENFKRGNCQYGDKCRFSHVIPGAPQPFGQQPAPFPQAQGFAPQASGFQPAPNQGGFRQQNQPPRGGFQAGAPPAPGGFGNFNPVPPQQQFPQPGFAQPRQRQKGNQPNQFQPQQPQQGFNPVGGFPGQQPGFNAPNQQQPFAPFGQPQQQSTQECKNFQAGKCTRGATCKFKHTTPPLGFPQPAGFPNANQPAPFGVQGQQRFPQQQQPAPFPQQVPQPAPFPQIQQHSQHQHPAPFPQVQQQPPAAFPLQQPQGFQPPAPFGQGLPNQPPFLNQQQPLNQQGPGFQQPVGFPAARPFDQGFAGGQPQQFQHVGGFNVPSAAPQVQGFPPQPFPGGFPGNPQQQQPGQQPKVKVCRDWSTKGSCRFGDRCRYLHTQPQQFSGFQQQFSRQGAGHGDMGFDTGDMIEVEPEMLGDGEIPPMSQQPQGDSSLGFDTAPSVSAPQAMPTTSVRGTASKGDLRGSDLETRMGPAIVVPGAQTEEEERAAFAADAFELGKIPENVAVLYKD